MLENWQHDGIIIKANNYERLSTISNKLQNSFTFGDNSFQQTFAEPFKKKDELIHELI